VTTRSKDRKTGRKGKLTSNLPVITLLTDFGTSDYFVGAVKGAILSVNPSVVIVDITHEIPPQDIEEAAFTILAAYQTFPNDTIHLVVVDPGVGSSRRALVLEAGDQLFVGPDNGIFTYIYDREPPHKTFQITNERYFRKPTSSTFHGRDVFAPVAAALSKGVRPEMFGSRIIDEVRLPKSVAPEVKRNGDVEGRVIHIDRFGNCITNITREAFQKDSALVVGRRTIWEFREFYDGARKGPFGIWGSAGFLEISVNGGSAAKLLKVRRGAKVHLTPARV
jgi:S-adenosyl-L-methionine hydrolase (adenosine-forming)